MRAFLLCLLAACLAAAPAQARVTILAVHVFGEKSDDNDIKCGVRSEELVGIVKQVLRANRIPLAAEVDLGLIDAYINFLTLIKDDTCITWYALEFRLWGSANYRGSAKPLNGDIQLCRSGNMQHGRAEANRNDIHKSLRQMTLDCIAEVQNIGD
jgi:hypothetical protein